MPYFNAPSNERRPRVTVSVLRLPLPTASLAEAPVVSTALLLPVLVLIGLLVGG